MFKHNNRFNSFLLRAIKVFTLFWFTLPASASAQLLLGVHPYLSPEIVVERFQPLANYLSLKLDMDVEVRVGRNYESHIQAIGRDNIDIAFLGPASYVRLVEDYGHKPILARLEANGRPSFKGHIIVRSDSTISSLSDLEQKYFAFGDKNSTMSRLVPQAMLEQHGVTLEKLSGYRFLKGHRNVAMAVLAGDADAGAIKEEVFQQFSDKGLRSLAVTPEISEHLFVTKADMDPALINQLREIMLEIRQQEQVELVLRPIKEKLTGLVPATDSDYDLLRELMHLVTPLQ